MKTKEEWWSELYPMDKPFPGLSNQLFSVFKDQSLAHIEAIQRDAWEAGKTAGIGYALEQVQHAREEGETDMRQVRAWIEHNELTFPEQ